MILAIMTPAGWIFMILGWSVIISITIYCFYKILRLNRFKDPKDPED